MARIIADHKLRALRGHEVSVWSAQFSADGKTVLTASSDNTARLWDVAERHGAARPARARGLGLERAFFGRRRDGADRQRDNTARLWDVASGMQLRALRGHEDSVVERAFSADGRRC